MSLKSIVKCFTKEQTNWPNIKGFIGECIGSDNKIYEAFFTTTEKDLIMEFKHLKYKLSQREIDKLKTLIEDYGQEKYEAGSFEAEQTEDI